MSTPPVVLWLRRDLRLHDHPALAAALEHARASGASLLPIFIWEPGILAGPRASANRNWFLRESLTELAASLRGHGSELIELQGPSSRALPALIEALRRDHGAAAIDVYATRDHTPYARARDQQIAALIAPLGATLHMKRGLVAVEPDELLTGGGTPYGVYTPYFRRWLERVEAAHHVPLPAPEHLPPSPKLALPSDLLVDRNALDQATQPTAQRDLLPAPGERAARERADQWIAAAQRGAGVAAYADRRNTLADADGTSRLSAALHLGLLSASELAARLLPLPPERNGERSGQRLWVSQLAWRDFYAQVLWHAPHAARSAWKPAYDAVRWSGDAAGLRAWQEGRTGYPIVDAAARQLLQSGFVHNRARMISASFLTKDLLVDWREGEAHFLRHLVDGDIAANNGGWQWSASTGTDAQPYFRIFNPVTQASNFDPDGAYVRRWIPELAALPAPAIHAPWAHPTALAAAGIQLGRDYPEPIVDHAVARARALDAYKSAVGASAVREKGDDAS